MSSLIEFGKKISKSQGYLISIEDYFFTHNRGRPEARDIPRKVKALLDVIDELEARLPIPEESRSKLGQNLPQKVDQVLTNRQQIDNAIWPGKTSSSPESQTVPTIRAILGVVNGEHTLFWVSHR